MIFSYTSSTERFMGKAIKGIEQIRHAPTHRSLPFLSGHGASDQSLHFALRNPVARTAKMLHPQLQQWQRSLVHVLAQ